MSFTLTGKEIYDLATFAGYDISKGNEDLDETEYTVYQNMEHEEVKDEDGTPIGKFKNIAILSEYPEEGGYPLGDKVT